MHVSNNPFLCVGKLNRIIKILLLIILPVSIIRLIHHRINRYLLVEVPVDDEIFFLEKYNFFVENGWYESIKNGTTPIFNLCIYVIDIFVDNSFYSMKVLNVFCLIIFITTFLFFLKSLIGLSHKYFLISILFIVSLTVQRNTFFTASNDSLFIVFILLGLLFLIKPIKKRSLLSFILSGIFFSLALGTRELFIFYLPGIFLILYVQNKSEPNQHILLFFISFFIFSTLIYLPSILENGTLKFANKDEVINSLKWVEKNYLEVYLKKTKISFEELQDFKLNNPSFKFPESYFEAIFLNLNLTVKNYLRQLSLTFKPFLWKLGGFYIIFIFWFFKDLIEKKNNLIMKVGIFYLTYTLVFCLIILYRVEFRWFMIFPQLIFSLSLSIITKKFSENCFKDFVFYLNILAVTLPNFFLKGIW